MTDTNDQLLAQATELLRHVKTLVHTLIEGDDPTSALALVTESSATMLSEVAPPIPQPEPIPELAAVIAEDEFDSTPVTKPVIIPKGHEYVVVREGDYVDTLTPKGRKVLGHRGTFATLDEATEFARFATERPLYIGEVSLDEEAPSEVYTRLKLSFAKDFD